MPDYHFDPLQVRALADESRVTQVEKEMLVVVMRLSDEVFVSRQLEVLATDFHRDGLFISESKAKAGR